MKLFSLVVLTFILLIPKLFSQINQVESVVIRRSGAYITMKPATYHLDVLPKIGERVVLSIYLKNNLPSNKSEGYYELFVGIVTKLIPSKKVIIIKGEQEISVAEKKHGIEQITFEPRQRVKICWTSTN